MKLKDIVAALEKIGIPIGLESLGVLAVLLPLLAAAAVVVVKFYKARGTKAAPLPLKAPGATEPPAIGARDLWRAFRRFVRRLPWQYRRSLPKFDHFVVFGLSGSGKSRLIEEQSDYRYQMQQVAGDAPLDPELPVALASAAVITEMPARFLEDQSERATRAVRTLFRRLYRDKSPTVVLALDVRFVTNAAPIELFDLARNLRVRVNQLAETRRHPIEVRIALTHTDALDGMHAVAEFWRRAGMSACIPLAAEGSTRPSLLEWENELNAQLPRALALLDAERYRSVLAFSRSVGRLLTPLETLLDALFAPDVLSKPPLRGGVYFCTSAAAELESPLKGVMESGPAPNPLRRHLVTSIAVSGAMIAYMILAYGVQHAVWEPAAEAVAKYSVSKDLVGSERERRHRNDIMTFTVRRAGVLDRFPDFFGDVRREFSEKLSKQLREGLFLPGLRGLAQDGVGAGLRWRRTVFYLSLIHSYRADHQHIKQRLDVWEEMTGLPRDVIGDYVDNTEQPYAQPVAFELGDTDADAAETVAYWRRLPDLVNKALADELLHPKELSDMKTLAQELERSLSRFKHDQVVLDVLRGIDDAADTRRAHDGEAPPRLYEAYASKFRNVLTKVQDVDLLHQVGEMKRLCSLVLAADITAPNVSLLRDLTDRLSLVHAADEQPAGNAIRLKLQGKEIVVDVAHWKEVVNESRATVLIDQFTANAARDESIFFDAEIDAELAPVVWNPLGTEATIFAGMGVLEGRYTKSAFERRVAKEVQRLAETLATLHIPKKHEADLIAFVTDAVGSYAYRYREEAQAFLKAFRLNVPSAEALRVALAQMAAERSPFDAFVKTLDENTRLSTEKPAKDDGGAGGASAAVAQKVETMLQPLHDALGEFASWAAAVGEGKDAPELGKYKAIIAQLLQDLTTALAPADEKTEQARLEQELSAVGRVALAASRAGEGSYKSLVLNWADAAGLTAEQRAPFLSPFEALSRLGEKDVTNGVASAWSRELAREIDAIARKFPFDRRAERAVSPEELHALFHPTEGKFVTWLRNYVEPLFPEAAGKLDMATLRKLGSLVPERFYRAAETARVLGERLWDPSGAPQPLEIRVTRVPFEHTVTSARTVPTMIYLHAGKASVFNFNQAPGSTTLTIDWMEDEKAELGVQLTNVETDANSYPPPLSAPGPYFRLLRLLAAGTAVRVRGAEPATRYEWSVPVGTRSRETVRTALIVHGDPWQGFSLLGRGGEP